MAIIASKYAQDIELCVRTQSGVDPFHNPTYSETWEPIKGVLIGQPNSSDVVNTYELYGKRIQYTIAIPEGDNHEWANTFVRFYGKKWRTIGEPVQLPAGTSPLEWNKQISVEVYDG